MVFTTCFYHRCEKSCNKANKIREKSDWRRDSPYNYCYQDFSQMPQINVLKEKNSLTCSIACHIMLSGSIKFVGAIVGANAKQEAHGSVLEFQFGCWALLR